VDKKKWLQCAVYLVSVAGSLALDLTAPNVKSILCSPVPLEDLNRLLSPNVAMASLNSYTYLDRRYGWGDYPSGGADYA
jgi:hypothetical protein